MSSECFRFMSDTSAEGFRWERAPCASNLFFTCTLRNLNLMIIPLKRRSFMFRVVLFDKQISNRFALWLDIEPEAEKIKLFFFDCTIWYFFYCFVFVSGKRWRESLGFVSQKNLQGGRVRFVGESEGEKERVSSAISRANNSVLFFFLTTAYFLEDLTVINF